MADTKTVDKGELAQGMASHQQQTMLQQFKQARSMGVPIVVLKTADPAVTIEGIDNLLTEKPVPMIQWDVVRGMTSLNKQAIPVLDDIANGNGAMVLNPVDALMIAEKMPPKSMLIVHNAQRLIDTLPFIQAVWILRDKFKANNRTLVLLCPDMALPVELANDVLILEEPLPDTDQLAAIVKEGFEALQLPEPDQIVVDKAVDALVGIAAFPAEQCNALSLRPDGLDMPNLWERKVKVIEQQKGLTVWRGGETFADVEACANVKGFISNFRKNTMRPIRAVMWIDEIDKGFAGLGANGGPGDNTGVTQDFLQQILKWWEDRKVRAILLTGFPGTGKSLMAKATAGEFGVPCIEFDMGAMKSSHLGDSEQALRNAIKVSEAMAPDGILAIATCNNVDAMPPELISRFRRGQFFFDLLDSDQRKAMWALHLKKQGLTTSVAQAQEQVDENRWTGREIEACCAIANEFQISIMDAALYVTPVARTMGNKVEQLRQFASGRFLDANKPGFFNHEGKADMPINGPRKRGMQLEN